MSYIDEPVRGELVASSELTTLNYAIENNKKLHKLRQMGRIEEKKSTELETTLEEYFDFCTSNDTLPTPAGMCNAIGIHHKRLLNLLKEDSEQGEIIQNAMEVMHSIYQLAVITGKMQVKVYTFMAKNYWGMTDKEIVEVKTADNDVRVVEIDSRLNALRQLSSQ